MAAIDAAGENWLAVDIARRRIAADQVIPIRREDRAADARRRRPDHLRIMSDVFPPAGAATAGKAQAGADAFRRSTCRASCSGRECPMRGHCEIFALARAGLTRRVNEVAEAREHRTVRSSMRGEAASHCRGGAPTSARSRLCTGRSRSARELAAPSSRGCAEAGMDNTSAARAAQIGNLVTPRLLQRDAKAPSAGMVNAYGLKVFGAPTRRTRTGC